MSGSGASSAAFLAKRPRLAGAGAGASSATCGVRARPRRRKHPRRRRRGPRARTAVAAAPARPGDHSRRSAPRFRRRRFQPRERGRLGFGHGRRRLRLRALEKPRRGGPGGLPDPRKRRRGRRALRDRGYGDGDDYRGRDDCLGRERHDTTLAWRGEFWRAWLRFTRIGESTLVVEHEVVESLRLVRVERESRPVVPRRDRRSQRGRGPESPSGRRPHTLCQRRIGRNTLTRPKASSVSRGARRSPPERVGRPRAKATSATRRRDMLPPRPRTGLEVLPPLSTDPPQDR